MHPFKIILQPHDFSPFADAAFELACSLARVHGSKLVVLHVTSNPPFVTPEGNVTEATFEAFKKRLWTQLRLRKPPDASIPVEYRLEVGDEAGMILQVAGEIHPDLIVIGSHGKGWLERLLMGSVAEKVLHEAACPVLTVKTPPPQ